MLVGVAGFPMPRNEFIAHRLLNAGYDLIVFGESQTTERLVACGAQSAATAKELAARCDAIFCCAADSPGIEQLLTSPDGVLAGARAGTVLFDVTIMSPLTARGLETTAARTGVHYLETPVSGGFSNAVESMCTMVSGDEAVFARYRPVLESVAQPVTYVGAAGAASVIKLLCELFILSFGTIVDEALTMAALAGVPGETVRQALLTTVAAPLVEQLEVDGSPVGWGATQAKFPLGVAAKLGRDFAPTGSLTMSAQILHEIAGAAGALGLPAPIITAVASIYQGAVDAGLPDVALATVLLRERVAGLGPAVATPP